MAIPSFVDRVTLQVRGGNGGHGCVSVHREKFKPLGGPDGGNGGDGGSVILSVDPDLTTLVDYHRQSVRKAENGQPGKGDHSNGGRGADVLLAVPPGTVVTDVESGDVLADLTGPAAQIVIAAGGKGGLGNAALASSSRKAPGFALLGEEGEERGITLELKVVADIGLVGFPSAGKSSLIAAISRARPKIADYPFTTLVPNLGVVVAGETTYTVADVPGLIEGASEGRGLGHDFLRHIERCSALVHVLDCATYEPGRDPLTDLAVIEAELAAHDRNGGSGEQSLADRPRLVVLNKIDIPDAAELAEIARPDLEAQGMRVFSVSTKSGEGLRELTFALAELVHEVRVNAAEPQPTRIVLRPEPVRGGPQFTIARQGDGEGGQLWRVRGTKPERWVRQTDFGNEEAVGFLADRFMRLGIEEKLIELGAVPGDAVAIGSGAHPVVFDFAPGVDVGAESLLGSDPAKADAAKADAAKADAAKADAAKAAAAKAARAADERQRAGKILSRRGEDHRLQQLRPAAERRRATDAGYHSWQAEGAPEPVFGDWADAQRERADPTDDRD